MNFAGKFGTTALVLTAAFSITSASTSFADGQSAAVAQDAQNFDGSQQAASEDIYADFVDVNASGPGGPGGGGGGWSRGVQCRAVNWRGMAFYGQGRNMPEARDQAMWNCRRVSSRCEMDGCQPL